MTPSQNVAEARQQLLEKLRRGETQLSNQPRPLVRQPRGSVTRVSPEQEQVWFHSRLAGNVPTYNESVTIHRRGSLDPLILERCFNEIIRRHDIWRSAFPMLDGKIVQRVDSNVQIRLPVIDLANLSTEEREQEALRLASEDVRRPFDLDVAPLFRVLLVRLAEDYHRIYLTLHHLVFDGVSIYRVLIRELATLYRAYSTAESSPLPDLAFQYSDYALFRHQNLAAYDHTTQLNYWRETLSGDLPSLQLPSDRSRPTDPTWRGEVETFVIPAPAVASVKDLSRNEGVTPYITLLAIFQLLLYRYSGQDDIVVGGATSTRKRPEFEPLIGYFLNTVVFRSRVSAHLSFREFLGYVRSNVLGALANSDIPFSEIVRELASKRDRGSHPLFQILFMMRPPTGEFPDGWDITDMEVHTGASSFDLFMDLAEHSNGIAGRVVYSTDVFDRPMIQRLVGHFQTLLQELLTDPNQAVSQVNLLTQHERHQLLVEWNATEQLYPQDRCVHQLFELEAMRTPEAVAVISGNQQMTYQQLDQRSTQLANHLHKLGVKPNDLVGVSVDRSLEMLVGLLGILKAGGAYVPLDPAYPPERLEFMLEDCQPRLLLTQRKLQNQLPSCQAQIVCLDTLVEETAGRDYSQPQGTYPPGDLAYVLYTSGSSGRPKGVEISHRALVNFLTAMKREPGMSSGDTLLAVTTLSFDIAALELFLPLISGARVIIASREAAADATSLSSLIERYGVTVMQATPATWRLLLAAGWNGSPELNILCGGEAWPAALAEEVLPRCKSLWNMYGPTETTIWSSVARVEAGKPVVIGKPIANTAFYILDPSQALVPVGVPGELYIGGDGIARGYLNRNQLTTERFVDDPFSRKPGAKLYKTGDLVRRLPDGTIEFLNRIDHQVKLRGFRIELGEIENVLALCRGVRQAVVVAREDATGEKRLLAYVVLDDEVDVEMQNVFSVLRAKLPEYMVPSSILTLPALPLTPNGKIDRSSLPEPTAFRDTSGQQFDAPQTSVEKRLAMLWSAILGVENIGRDDNFFQLGGHSISAVRLFALIDKSFQVQLPLASLLRAPTLAELAQLITRKDSSSQWSSLVPIQPNGSKAPLFCVHGHLGQVLFARPLSELLSPDQPLYGLQSRGLLGKPGHRTIEEMAADYVKEIRGVQPHGPYLIAGYCFGGTVAFEMAQQLRAAGENVALLALLNTFPPPSVRYGASRRFRLWVNGFAIYVHKVTQWKERRNRFASRLVHRFWQRGTDLLLKRLVSRCVIFLRGERAHGWQAKFLSVPEMNMEAIRKYHPQPYDGTITLFRCAEPGVLLSFDARLEWRRFAAGGLTVCDLPGDLESLFEQPYVKELAQQFSTHLTPA